MTLMNKSKWNEGIRLRKVYEEELRPLISRKDYGVAFKFLLQHKELKAYLENYELMEMYNFLEENCMDLSIMARVPKMTIGLIQKKLDGLEGRTE
jgi:hypothetical protein